MSSSEIPPPSKKIKRTSFTPWSTGMGSNKSTPKKDATNPEPARIVSDIARQTEGDASKAATGLSGHPKIMEVQKEWEKKKNKEREEGGDSRAGSAGTESSVGSEPGTKRTPLDRRENASSKRGTTTQKHAPLQQLPRSQRPVPFVHGPHKRPIAEILAQQARENELIEKELQEKVDRFNATQGAAPSRVVKVSKHDAKAHARRFTEEAVMKQMAKLAEKDWGKTESSGSGSPSAFGPSMNFTTPTELLQRIKMDTMAHTAKALSGKAASSSLADSIPDTASKNTSAVTPKNGDRLTAIPLAEDGRLYTQYLKPDGTTESGRGCLFPAGYKHHDDSELPFICPVRDCRRLFSGLKGLGGHFSAGHCATTLIDNCDGTLTKIGAYQKQGPGGTPGIVISKNPLGSDAAPVALPGVPWLSRTSSTDPSLSNSNEQSRNSATGKGTSTKNGSGSSSTDVKTYLHSHLHEQQRTFKREDVHLMLQLPRLRTLPQVWLDNHQETMLDITHYSCALAYLVGREVTGKAQCMAHIRHGPRPTSRLSIPCIALPHNMNSFAKTTFSNVDTCVGCKYWSYLQRRSNTCDWSGQEFKPRGVLSVPTPTSATDEIPDLEPIEIDDDESDDDDTDTDSDPEPVTKPSRQSDPAPEVPPIKTIRERKRKRPLETTTASRIVTLRQPTVQANVQSAEFSSVDLEMEDWEIAPGRMRDVDGSENIAFSNSYLTTGQPVTVSEDVSFNVLVIKPGSVSHWSVEDDKLRTCSVASGKVKVTMGEKVFRLGPNGMFVVRPGQTCKVENRIYLDSVVHCTTIADFELR